MKKFFQRCSVVLVVSVFFLLTTGTAFAHKVRIFAYEESGAIVGETAFSGGRPARNAEIVVKDKATGTILTTTRTDVKGAFSFPVPERAGREHLNLQLIVNAGEGHRGEWLLAADEYLSSSASSAGPEIHSASGTLTGARKLVKHRMLLPGVH